MNQRKLTDKEQLTVGSAVHFLYQAAGLSGGTGDCWRNAIRQLNEMLNHGTTDGCQFVEPEPPIPDGYRLAVAGDEGRKDCLYWSDGKKGWARRAVYGVRFCSQDKHIVPVDRIPTDEDAKLRPEVMVRDYDGQAWLKRKLIHVMPKKDRAFIVADDFCLNSWQQCRYPYLGE